ncbi:LuxR C-terminal-related transcriptional regulator [Streptomyces sp. NPDC050121]|uniref:LuxR C-terminal-related transcriptional regulator n=1 Tax=Streptomyces sp. NPDC050121 TaxID=3365601 RepID=UPI0037BCF7E8
MTTVLIASDQALQRACYRMLLAAQPDLTVVGEAATCAETMRRTADLHPDVVLLDIRVPPSDGVESIRRITRPGEQPAGGPGPVPAGPPRVLILAPTDFDEFALDAVRAGASGFLLKDASLDELTAAIRAVGAGDAVLSPGLTRELIETLRRPRPARSLQRDGRLDLLTEREREVLTAIASGWSTTEIAQRLSIAPTTVKTHIRSILIKIGACARVQAVVFAYETGLVRPR